MRNIIHFFILINIFTSNAQTKTSDTINYKNIEQDITITYPKVNLRKIEKWKSLNAIQKEWIKVEKDKEGYLIYEPCDGNTETIKIEGARLTINWRIENPQKLELEKFTRLTKNDAFRADAHDYENKKEFEIKAKIVDYQNGIVLWEFDDIKWLMTPKENYTSFRIVKNNCKTEKKKELEFLPIEKW